jgi:adenosylcobinamide-GDP ribazoletransferase
MARPDAGAFGVGAAGSALLLRWAALASMPPAPLLLGALWCLSRTAMAVTAMARPCARPAGLAAAFLGGSPLPVAAGGLTVAVMAAGLGRGVAGLAAGVAAGAGAAAVVALAQRRIGGFTGDVLGAAGVVGETAGLVVAAGRW